MTGTVKVNLRILASYTGGQEHEVATATADIPFKAPLAPDAGALTAAIKNALCHCDNKDQR